MHGGLSLVRLCECSPDFEGKETQRGFCIGRKALASNAGSASKPSTAVRTDEILTTAFAFDPLAAWSSFKRNTGPEARLIRKVLSKRGRLDKRKTQERTWTKAVRENSIKGKRPRSQGGCWSPSTENWTRRSDAMRVEI